MSQAEDIAPEPPRQPPVRKGGRVHLSLLAELAITLIVLAMLAVGARFGPLTAPGRAVIMAYLDGVSLGPLGRLHATGLHGDIWSDFTIDRLSVSDPQGIWLDVSRLELRWRPEDLLLQRFYSRSVSAEGVRVFRRPELGRSPPAKPGAEAPLSVRIDHLDFHLETRPAFSVKPGLFDIAANLDLNRKGGIGGVVKARSLLRPSDGLNARFDLGLTGRLFLDAAAREGDGGAISGMLGLPADQAFTLSAKADGDVARGRFHLQAVSGTRTPATADGAWTKTGGQASATLLLAASSFTAPYAAMLGPRLNISLNAPGGDANNLNVMGSVRADNLTGSVSGLVDRKDLSAPKGLKISAVVRDLTRITATPSMGAGAFNGTWTGGAADWRLAGALAINKLAMGGYTLARAEGPLNLSLAKGELRLQASLAGQGGAGRGVAAALGGARPRLSLQASQLPDGRILLRSLNADGAGLDLAATGDRNLFGGLNLKGTLRLSNLAAAGAGATGRIDTKWSAIQARAKTPWNLTLDAQGQGLASGYAELDRLLGPKPALHVQTDFAQGVIAVTDARLTGAAANLAAKGEIGKGGDLKLALNWNAQGPFDAGPLEIAGKANGSGALTGTLATPRADLIADFERIDLPELALKPAHVVLSFVHGAADTDGLIAITAGGDYGPAHAKAGFRFVSNGIDLKDMDAAAGGLT
ncbi:MAG TPA: translocation/assembly module TamB, partial [Caulobacteraceae bacterium]|nr:translocation/assembly module TamB [Caulobacteraceae bacterium]